MIELTISSGVAPPANTNGRPRTTIRKALEALQPAQSFTVPEGLEAERVRRLASVVNRLRPGRRLSVRTMPDGSLRCFRVA